MTVYQAGRWTGLRAPRENGMETSTYRESLLKKRSEILSSGGGVKPLQETMGDVNSRQGDLADQASGNNEVHIQLKLKQTDAKILQAIEEALKRIDKGTYGICRDCGEVLAREIIRPRHRDQRSDRADRLDASGPIIPIHCDVPLEQ